MNELWSKGSPWHEAAERGDVEEVRRRIAEGAEVDAPGRVETTALMLAARHGWVDLIGLLLEHGASTSVVDGYGFTAMTYGLITKLGGKLRRVDVPDPRPLEMLLAAGGRLGLREAAYLGDVDLARRCLEEGADPDTGAGNHDGPLLMTAAVEGDLGIVGVLLDYGANIAETDDLGQTPLLCAAERGQLAAVRLLLDRGANIDETDWSSRSALARAALGGHREVADLLLDRGASRGPIDTLVMAVGDTARLRTLLNAGEGFDEFDRVPDQLARLAAAEGHLQSLALLLDRGVADLPPYSRRSLLAEAAGRGQVEVIRLLLDRGADLQAVGYEGVTALEWARRGGHHEAAKLLEAAG